MRSWHALHVLAVTINQVIAIVTLVMISVTTDLLNVWAISRAMRSCYDEKLSRGRYEDGLANLELVQPCYSEAAAHQIRQRSHHLPDRQVAWIGSTLGGWEIVRGAIRDFQAVNPKLSRGDRVKPDWAQPLWAVFEEGSSYSPSLAARL